MGKLRFEASAKATAAPSVGCGWIPGGVVNPRKQHPGSHLWTQMLINQQKGKKKNEIILVSKSSCFMMHQFLFPLKKTGQKLLTRALISEMKRKTRFTESWEQDADIQKFGQWKTTGLCHHRNFLSKFHDRPQGSFLFRWPRLEALKSLTAGLTNFWAFLIWEKSWTIWWRKVLTNSLTTVTNLDLNSENALQKSCE